MIIFLYGEDSFRRKRKYTEIISEFIAKNGKLGFSEFSAEEVDKFLETIKSKSLFSPRTLISIKDIDISAFSSDIKKVFESTLLRILDSTTTVVLIASMQTSLPTEIPLLSNDAVKSQEFINLSKEKLIFFVEKEATKKSVKLSLEDIQSLIASVSGDLWSINSELDKLVSAKSYSPVFSNQATPGYFELLNTVKYNRAREQKLIALEIILYKLKEDPARVFNGLAYSSPRGIAPEKWFSVMADYDIAVKSGKMDYEEALLDFVIR